MLALFSNNPLFLTLEDQCEICEISKGSALPVLRKARDKIHGGWKILHHPLYGNFKPYQQAYRSILLEKIDKRKNTDTNSDENNFPRVEPDLVSLHLIEEALKVYSSSKILSPEDTPEVMRRDSANIDLALMEMTLQQAGLEVPPWPQAISKYEKILTEQKNGG